MKTRYHIEITTKALGDRFAENPLKTIIQANVRQDKISNQFGHDFIHFDGSAFREGFAYIEQQKQLLIAKVLDQEYEKAQESMGRLLHTWQDFYSHSNYISLWLNKNRGLQPEKIIFDDQEIITSPDLKSGKNYGFLEFACMIPLLSKFITPLMPEDSHAKMNLDSPKAGLLFYYAFEAALERTTNEYLAIMNELTKLDGVIQNTENFLGKSLQ